MKIIGVDFGTRKVGFAISDGILAEPYSVIRYDDEAALMAKIKRVCDGEGVEKVVVGVSESDSARKSVDFGKKLSEFLGIQVVFQDETLTTYDAKDLALKAGINKNKRHKLEDAYSAALILQSYLDQNKS